MAKQASILVIDDEPNLRNTLAAILQRGGYLATLAGDGKEALACLQGRDFDLAFLDLKLPDTSGLDLLPKIHQVSPELPVLILTAHATLESAMQAVRAGARDYMLKPIDPPFILARVSEILAEQAEPLRRRQIISQVQDLLAELRQVDSPGASSSMVAVPVAAVDPDRFVQCGIFTADLHTRHLIIESHMAQLPPTTFDYMVTLMRYSPEVVSFENLVKESQGFVMTRSEAREMTRWHIHKIRKALEPDTSNPRYVITVRDVGYRLVA